MEKKQIQMKFERFYSRIGKDNNYENLIDHLRLCGELCSEFADTFACKNVGRLLGQIHDIGKRTDRFQAVLRHEDCKINHAALSGLFMKYCNAPELTDVVSGHHFGLHGPANLFNYNHFADSGVTFEEWVDGKRVSFSSAKEIDDCFVYLSENNLASRELIDAACKEFQAFYEKCDDNLWKMLASRFIMSCLVDADYTSAAMFSDPDYRKWTERESLNPSMLLENLEEYRKELKASSTAANAINEIREEVFNACSAVANPDNKIFTLTAPTGSGKTLAMLNFALRKAMEKGHERIIYVLPFLSVTEQTLDIYQKICGENIVFESDSNTEYTEENKELKERWTAPIIITTMKTFCETLFSNKPQSLRKLHNIANSVICFDEIQSLPLQYNASTMGSLKYLSQLGSTVLLASATMPEYSRRCEWDPVEIISNPQALFDKCRKAREVEVAYDIKTPKTNLDILRELKGYDSFMVVFNLKRHVREMYDLLKEEYSQEELFCIYTDLCPDNRKENLQKIHERLKEGKLVKIVATSCIEAGVDMDIPAIYRAICPATSIIQTAGRTGRNGTMKGRLVLFRPDDEKIFPSDEYELQSFQTELILKEQDFFDIYSLRDASLYYSKLFSTHGFDKDCPALIKSIQQMDYIKVNEAYRIIPANNTFNIVVPYNREIFDSITDGKITKKQMMQARGTTVQVYDKKFIEGAEPLYLNGYPLNWYKSAFYNSKTGIEGSGTSLVY